MPKKLLPLGVVALAAFAATAPADNKQSASRNTAAQLAGNYTIVSGEREGQQVTPDQLHGDMVTFTEDTVKVTDKDKNETYVASYKLDTSEKPWQITMTEKVGPTKGEKARGLIERRGNLVKLVYALPGGDMPTGFDKTKPKQLMFVMKRNEK